MASLKCKYCGGDIEKYPNNVLGTCTACGSTMTVPKSNDPKRIAAHNAGNYFRRSGNFDKALELYQRILEEDPMDAEASWCSALCRYGVTYEKNPDSGTYFPDIHAHPNGNFMENGDLLAALAHSDGATRLRYEQEATRISQLLEPTVDVSSRPPKDTKYLLKQAYLFLEQCKWQDADQCCDKLLAIHPDNAMAWLGKLLAEVKRQKPKDLMECRYSFEYSSNYQNAVKYADPTLRRTLQSALEQVKKLGHQRQTEDDYQKACAVMKHASSQEQYKRAAALFSRLSGYRDADKRLQECLKSADVAQIDAIYLEAVSAATNARTILDYRKAVEMLERTRGWRDTDQRIKTCIEQLEVLEAAQAERNAKAAATAQKLQRKLGWKKLLAFTGIALAVLSISGYFFFTKHVIPERKYKAAEALLEIDDKEHAIIAFQNLGDYKDASDRALQIQHEWYSFAELLLEHGDYGRAAAAFGGLKDFSDSRERCLNLWDTIAVRPHLCAGGWYTAALRPDGTAIAVGDNRDGQCELESWEEITAVSAGWSHTIGLKPDGTVISEGYNGDGRGSVDIWDEIVAISAGQWHTVGLKLNGTVIGIGCENDGRLNFDGWEEIMAISAGRNHTVALRSNRSVLAVGSNEYGQCDVGSWTNITAISAGGNHTVGLREDGTVVAAGSNEEAQCQVSRWDNIVAVAAGYYHTVGLRADGTVIATGLNDDGQCEIGSWKDIVAIAAGGWHTVGLKADGTVVAVGRNVNGQCDTAEWSDMI